MVQARQYIKILLIRTGIVQCMLDTHVKLHCIHWKIRECTMFYSNLNKVEMKRLISLQISDSVY